MIVDPQPVIRSTNDSDSHHCQSYEDMAEFEDACGDYPARTLERLLGEAARLISLHDDGSPAYYQSLNPDVIGRWVIGDAWHAPDRYESKNTALLRDILTRHCDTMRCAASYANNSFDNTWNLLTDGISFDSFRFSERQFAVDSLRYPGLRNAAHALIDRQRYRSQLFRHESGREAQYSRLTQGEWPALFERHGVATDDGTYRLIFHDDLPEQLQPLIHEPSVLVIESASLAEVELHALTKSASREIFEIDVSGMPTTCLTFASGLLRVPVIGNRAFLSEIRSHLCVAYVFEDHALLVEYPWCGMTAKARIAAAESLEIRASRDPSPVPPAGYTDILACKFMVNHVQGLPTGRLDVWADEIPF
ncbi:hypothetical protein P3T18_003118 [Paraburkholderia sp. GAS199]|uniref:hypothetical protein n=1 Tax=Paraburkholderia sp. GAS199 TaxID=3035126 RepID=UPI003D24FCA5